MNFREEANRALKFFGKFKLIGGTQASVQTQVIQRRLPEVGDVLQLDTSQKENASLM